MKERLETIGFYCFLPFLIVWLFLEDHGTKIVITLVLVMTVALIRENILHPIQHIYGVSIIQDQNGVCRAPTIDGYIHERYTCTKD